MQSSLVIFLLLQWLQPRNCIWWWHLCMFSSYLLHWRKISSVVILKVLFYWAWSCCLAFQGWRSGDEELHFAGAEWPPFSMSLSDGSWGCLAHHRNALHFQEEKSWLFWSWWEFCHQSGYDFFHGLQNRSLCCLHLYSLTLCWPWPLLWSVWNHSSSLGHYHILQW